MRAPYALESVGVTSWWAHRRLREVHDSRSPSPSSEVLEQLLPPQLRDYLSQSSREPEHRTIAVAFVCFDHTDAILADEGPRALTTAIDEALQIVQNAAAAHDVCFLGTDVDIDGGKIILVGGAPRSAGDDTDRLLTAVREAVRRAGRLPLRAGIAHGRVFTGDTGSPTRRTYSVKGDAVNLAARLAGHADLGSILMAADVLDHTRRYYAVNEAPAATLKGKSQPVPVVTLGDPLEPRRQQNLRRHARRPRHRNGDVDGQHGAASQWLRRGARSGR